MDLIDRLKQLAARIEENIEQLQTEEATKNALIMPFINALGYNVFDPTEVVPEFVADVGLKKGEKVDYAIMSDGKAIILVEAKCADVKLGDMHGSQLYRYFSVTNVRIGVLTNGVVYKFFSDLEEPNKMDRKPFFEFNLLDFKEDAVEELKKFAKERFEIESILSTASTLKYTNGIKRLLMEEWTNPSKGFIRLLARRVYSGNLTEAVQEQFAEIIKQAFRQFVSEKINERLTSAMATDTPQAPSEPGAKSEEPPDDETGIVTTEEEVEGFYIVRAILHEVVDVNRVFMRDTMSYCGVLFDDNNRKPICRLHFNSSRKKYIGVFDEKKQETRHAIDSISHIYQHSDTLKNSIKRYLGEGE